MVIKTLDPDPQLKGMWIHKTDCQPYLSVGDPELGRGIQEPEESAVTVKWRHVEQQLTGLKGEQEGAHAPDILEETLLKYGQKFRIKNLQSGNSRLSA